MIIGWISVQIVRLKINIWWGRSARNPGFRQVYLGREVPVDWTVNVVLALPAFQAIETEDMLSQKVRFLLFERFVLPELVSRASMVWPPYVDQMPSQMNLLYRNCVMDAVVISYHRTWTQFQFWLGCFAQMPFRLDVAVG